MIFHKQKLKKVFQWNEVGHAHVKPSSLGFYLEPRISLIMFNANFNFNGEGPGWLTYILTNSLES